FDFKRFLASRPTTEFHKTRINLVLAMNYTTSNGWQNPRLGQPYRLRFRATIPPTQRYQGQIPTKSFRSRRTFAVLTYQISNEQTLAVPDHADKNRDAQS